MTHHPRSVAELADLVRAHDSIAIRGAGTKSPAADPNRVTIDLTQLTGISEYAPDECVFSARAGTPLGDIEQQLAAHGQYLPFDPPLVEAGATIGGTVAMGVSGSGRYRYGGVRDFIIGARIVDGNGTVIRSGGKVVKNAAGFLLHHGMVGSAGRFGVIAELTFKVFPTPEARATIRVERGTADEAFALAQTIESRRFDLEALDFDARGTVWMRVAGRAEALTARVAQLRKVAGDSDVFDGSGDTEVWRMAREFAWAPPATSIVKVPTERPLTNSHAARYICAGRAMWMAAAAPGSLTGITGVVVRGPTAGRRLGAAPNQFEERVRRVLDPRNRFSAAPDSDR